MPTRYNKLCIILVGLFIIFVCVYNLYSRKQSIERFNNSQRLIPKVIYQTWKTKDLPKEIEDIRKTYIDKNPDYELKLFDDDDMDNFIKLNFDNTIFSAYSKINIGAGKSDFWRYCILYVNGGVYLDIDSTIEESLDNLIGETDQCVISREGGFGNQGKFLQWCLIFQKGHPILKELIDICVDNINKKVSTNLVTLTGPIPYTKAINNIMGKFYSKKVENLYYESDKKLNRELNNPENEVRAKFHKHDYRPFMKFEMNNDLLKILRKGTVHWKNDKTPVISD